MSRVHNFNPGPTALPLEVLKEAQNEMLDYKGEGMSIMEMSHRTKSFDKMHSQIKQDISDVLGLSEEDKILFLGGGASTQFAMIPYNFLTKDKVADYIDTGTWSSKAIKEAKLLGSVNVIASSKEKEFTYIPKDFKIDDNACYLHITSNNTIRGTQWHSFPDTGNIPLICDMSSDIASKRFDAKKFSLIYAGAQKNIGPSGVTLVIVKQSMMDKIPEGLLTMLNYKTHVENDSLYNTPPVWGMYMVGLVFKWIKNLGGIEKMEEINNEKAKLLYDYLDSSNGFYRGTAEMDSRSKMNVPFRLTTEELEVKVVAEAKEKNLIGLKGHRSVGGMRASIYNAVPKEAIIALIDFLEEFRKNNS